MNGLMKRLLYPLLVAVAMAQLAPPVAAQTGTVSPPDPIVIRPGGDGNRSQYEYTPEKQPSWNYTPPVSAEDACMQENALLQDKARDLETEVMMLQQELENLKARNAALQRAASSSQ